jgi:hypothetical protein
MPFKVFAPKGYERTTSVPERTRSVNLLVWNGFAANVTRCLPIRQKRTGVRHVAAPSLNAPPSPTPIRWAGRPPKWIIAVSCFRGGTRLAESLHHSEPHS